jgi:hypothetical protein
MAGSITRNWCNFRPGGGGTLREIFSYDSSALQQSSLDLDESGALEPGRYSLTIGVSSGGQAAGANCQGGCSRGGDGGYSGTLTFGDQ